MDATKMDANTGVSEEKIAGLSDEEMLEKEALESTEKLLSFLGNDIGFRRLLEKILELIGFEIVEE